MCTCMCVYVYMYTWHAVRMECVNLLAREIDSNEKRFTAVPTLILQITYIVPFCSSRNKQEATFPSGIFCTVTI